MNVNTKNPREAALLILQQIFLKGAYANLAMAQGLRGAPLSALDRKLATELVYGTVKTMGTLDWYLGKVVNRALRKLDPLVLVILRLGAYQILYLDRIPDSAACNESVKLTKKYVYEGAGKLVNGALRQLARTRDQWKFPEGPDHELERIALEYYHPEWLVRRWKYRYGLEEAVKLCEFDNARPVFSLRVNTLAISREALRKQLAEEGIETHVSRWSPDGLLCDTLPSLEALIQEFGRDIYIQDESSMLDGAVLDPAPGDRVIDLCSAPGGKTTHLAQKMQDRGEILALDLYEHKLALVRQNAERLGTHCIRTQKQDGTVLVPEWENTADKVLVDAPCSGLGVLNRRAEARWTKEERGLSQFPPLQKKILANGARYVKPGGRLLYSTCTLEQDENTRVRKWFLEQHPEFRTVPFPHPLTGESVEELQLLPQRDGINGFYLCLFEKTKESKE
ncbi:16S rRNA (cytosine(967)-C(5))-methyltransferase RsmB [uncultured Acidaminococcus sp.]|uniref:16S rRNA (cytosine(967)-C(5))-methyltransferase RsmB n=1 Tax=uncultured Acidaminococcus sp. TaxID=352152 RepID=UPI0025962440|nr:16S rRNA (cytosine(967)-C(5))-methyltransferase RsmB [uncultured Acidaminococcus sp.]